MIRKLKTLGLNLVAILALSAVFAASSSATGTPFHSEAATTIIIGNQATANILHMGGYVLSCSTVEFKGTTSAATQTHVTVTPHYRSCSAFGFATAHVNATDCEFTIGKSYVTVQKHNSTPNACSTTFTPTFFGSSICTVHVEPNPNVDYPIHLTNQGAGTTQDILVTWTMNGITWRESQGDCVSGTHGTDGNYTGTMTAKGFNPATGAHVGIWVT